MKTNRYPRGTKKAINMASIEIELFTYAAGAVVLFLLFNHFMPMRRNDETTNREPMKLDMNQGII